MLRITRMGDPESVQTLKLEGKLVGPWVRALQEACEPGTRFRLDLSAVNFVDGAGVTLLRELLAQGVTLARCPELIVELLHLEDR